ncbi:MAG TPA: class I SAM-dependent methyltransferase [Blastocatellia bacterium]|nr:class I SAM-dependent methyltransferase [Blastocatellia bacterium]
MKNEYSRTAEAVAFARAVEQAYPAAQRILTDPYAAEFLRHPYYRLASASRLLSWGALNFLAFWAPGGQEYLMLRARFVDDLAIRLAGEGLRQIVLLGAGLDSMALRIGPALRQVTVYEVDHPATQALKREGYERIGVPDNLRFVAVDFEKDEPGARLRAAGFDPAQRSLIVWLGVTYYLTEQAMARALRQIAEFGAGTCLVFDYILKEVVDGTSRNLDALDKARRVAWLGEPWIFGLEPERVGEYLAQFGFTLLEDYEFARLHQRYCPARRLPMNYSRLVVCERR